MNRTTRNQIATAIAPHTGNGRTTADYSAILNIVREFGFIIGKKAADQYTADMTSKHNTYLLEDLRTGEEIEHMLVIDEYFGYPKTETVWVFGKGLVKKELHIDHYEITAYVS